MLASINPLGERARNQRYWVTVAAYVVGVDGRGRARSARCSASSGTPVAVPRVALVVVAVLAAPDSRSTRARSDCACPGRARQVDENWLVTYRGWVYGAGFGAQLGLAFVTIVTASATWVAFACALFSGQRARRAR